MARHIRPRDKYERQRRRKKKEGSGHLRKRASCQRIASVGTKLSSEKLGKKSSVLAFADGKSAIALSVPPANLNYFINIPSAARSSRSFFDSSREQTQEIAKSSSARANRTWNCNFRTTPSWNRNGVWMRITVLGCSLVFSIDKNVTMIFTRKFVWDCWTRNTWISRKCLDCLTMYSLVLLRRSL